jgi:hypothetical protein
LLGDHGSRSGRTGRDYQRWRWVNGDREEQSILKRLDQKASVMGLCQTHAHAPIHEELVGRPRAVNIIFGSI